jgi:NIPSNAP
MGISINPEKFMRHIRNLTVVIAALFVGILVGWSTSPLGAQPEKPTDHVYELRTYTTHEGRLPALNERFKNHTIQLFEKHGMKNVVYCTPIDKDGKPVENTLVYLLAHKSQQAARDSFAAFGKDEDWIKARTESEKDGKIVAKVESQFLVPTDYSPMK